MVANAAPVRVAEFAAGRACARAALQALDIADFELLNGKDRAPLWPAGIAGSISHTTGFCGAVAARDTQVLALGLDAEVRRRVQPQLWRRICTAEECHWLAQLSADQAAEHATVIFSAKEAFYKAQYPLTRQWLNFTDVSLLVEGSRFRVQAQGPLALAGLRPGPWWGSLLLDGTHVITLVRLD